MATKLWYRRGGVNVSSILMTNKPAAGIAVNDGGTTKYAVAEANAFNLSGMKIRKGGVTIPLCENNSYGSGTTKAISSGNGTNRPGTWAEYVNGLLCVGRSASTFNATSYSTFPVTGGAIGTRTDRTHADATTNTVLSGVANGILFLFINNTTVSKSSDGTSFSAVTLPGSASWRSCAYNGSVFLMTNGTTSGGTSSDGSTFSSVTFPAAFFRISAIGNTFYATLASATTTFYKSTDGVNWTAVSTLPNLDWGTIVGVPNGRLIVFSGGTTTSYQVSDDGGTTWSTKTITSGTWGKPVYGNGIIMVPEQTNGGSSIAVSYNNGDSFTIVTVASGYHLAAAYGGGCWAFSADANNLTIPVFQPGP